MAELADDAAREGRSFRLRGWPQPSLEMADSFQRAGFKRQLPAVRSQHPERFAATSKSRLPAITRGPPGMLIASSIGNRPNDHGAFTVQTHCRRWKIRKRMVFL